MSKGFSDQLGSLVSFLFKVLFDQRFLRLVDDFVVVAPGSCNLFLNFGLLLALGHRHLLINVLLYHFVLVFHGRVVPFHLTEDLK